MDSRKDGTLNQFVCDFIQDEHGRFHFLKISDFHCDGKPNNTLDWVVSTKQTDIEQKKRERLAAKNECHAKLICEEMPQLKRSEPKKAIAWATIEKKKTPDKKEYKHAKLMEMFENSLRSFDMWYDGSEMVYPTQQRRHVTKYKEEINIAHRKAFKQNGNAKFVTSFFLPLLTFPDRTDKNYRNFELKMKEAQTEMEKLDQSIISNHHELNNLIMTPIRGDGLSYSMLGVKSPFSPHKTPSQNVSPYRSKNMAASLSLL